MDGSLLVIWAIRFLFLGLLYLFLARVVLVLLRDLRAATREIRPDWDLAKPGLREAWAADNYSQFHGWDKRTAASPSAS